MYQDYFENYVPSCPSPNIRLPKISPISDSELNGFLTYCTSQYLYDKKFPPQLISALIIQLRKESQHFRVNELKVTESEKFAGLADEDDDCSTWYNPHKLKDMVIKKLDEICLMYAKKYSPKELELQSSQAQGVHEISYTSARNRRRTLEDRFVVFPRMDTVFGFNARGPVSYFAVFDGHNGTEAASFAAAHLHFNLMSQDYFPNNMDMALTAAFVGTDDDFVVKSIKTGNQSGTTALVAIFIGSILFVAWAGDSQAILAYPDRHPEILVQSHKPENVDETSRIVALGGQVVNGRVNGVLAVSRAIGDLDLKEFVIPNPDVTRVDLNGTEEFLVLASDGLWDDVNPELCVDIVKEHLVATGSAEGLSQKLAEEAESRGSTDNTTVLVILLQPLPQLLIKYTEEISNNVSVDVDVNVKALEPHPAKSEVPEAEASSLLKNRDHPILNKDKLLHIPNSSLEDNTKL